VHTYVSVDFLDELSARALNWSTVELFLVRFAFFCGSTTVGITVPTTRVPWYLHMCVHTKFSIYARISARQSLKLQISNLCSCISCHTVLLLNSPWSSPFSKILEVVSRPEFAQDHESGLRSDRGPVVLCDFSKLRYWKSPYKFFKFVWEILPIQPTIQTRKKISPPSFFSKMRTFFKNWPRWL
jgi:hypothetical protein